MTDTTTPSTPNDNEEALDMRPPLPPEERSRIEEETTDLSRLMIFRRGQRPGVSLTDLVREQGIEDTQDDDE